MKNREIKNRLKEDLLRGRRIKRSADQPRYGTVCLPEFKRELKADGLPVLTVKEKAKDGTIYGVYVLKKFLRKNDVLWAK